MKLKNLIIAVAVLAVSACSTVATKNEQGMFAKYDDFRPGPKGGVDFVWAREGIRSQEQLIETLLQYDNIMLDRTWLVLDDKTQYDNISEQDLEELTTYLTTKITQKAQQHFTLVDKVQPKTLLLSIALTNVKTPNPILAITSSIMPVGLGMSTISKVVTGEHTNVGSATIELMLTDAQSGKPIIAAIDRQAGNKDLGTMIDSLDDAKDAIDFWVERLGQALKTNKSK
ncbi:DUF3313 domain-containing protein [Motilimonas pumila]|uniref:DUF3313 domain-containing protein n=1 Tax=Motilimonas pumila TaxID=2303987 RepID=A0A418YBD6_9GAMM|nr:DUF3313 domain-containing protein [Motilimonas pumila]RJG40315.1 DUF3313 domain-containing protein [Motilimonas pumila]